MTKTSKTGAAATRLKVGLGCAWFLIAISGCSHVSTHLAALADATHIRAEETRDLAEIRRDTRDELAAQRSEALRMEAERDVELARLEAERRRMEIDFCRANQEALQQRLKSNIRETMETRVGFDVTQGLEFGEIEVDTEALKKLLEDRDKQPVEGPPQQPFKKEPCSCCDQPCGCRSGFIRRMCPNCKHKSCEAEDDCGGPAALQQLEQQPLKKPLRPVDIPLKMAVKLRFGVENPDLEAARIRREPILTSEPFHQPPCDTPCRGQCTCGRCGVKPLPDCTQSRGQSTSESNSPGESAVPPPPVPPAPVSEQPAVRRNIPNPKTETDAVH